MYRKVLSALNEHLNSEVAARYALALARVTGAKLHLAFIAEKGLSPSDISNAEEAIKRLFIEAGEAGIGVEAISETGDPVRKLSGIVKSEGIDLVFAATRREDLKKRFYAGTVARKLSVALPCSIALVRVVHFGRLRPAGILVPLKARIDHVEERAYFTAKMTEAFGSALYLLHAPKAISRFFHGDIHLTPLQWEKKLPKDISRFMEHLKRHEVAHIGKSVPGRASKAIAIEALAKRHDLIIMGASRRSLLSRLLKGNPVEEILSETPSDLIIFRPRGGEGGHPTQQL